MTRQRVIVVGGGVAGLMAAGQAASGGAKVVLLEKMDRPARKLGLTGKGRCNLTNTAELPDFIEHFGNNGKFLRQAFARFFSFDLVAFLGELGVGTEVERGGRVFPVGNDAHEVVNALVSWAKDRGVNFYPGSPVQNLIVDGQRTTGVHTVSPENKEYRAAAVIIATGGVSYPATGSTGDGYRLAEAVGHTIIPIRPALIPLMTVGDLARRLQGLSLRNVAVRVLIDGKKQGELFGEMLFTHFGVSGPIILTLSRQVVDALRRKAQVVLSLDLKPALEEVKLDARLLRDLDTFGKRSYRTILKELLPKKLIPVCIELTGINPETKGHQITATQRKCLRMWLKDFRLEITGHRPIAEAIITAGGVDTREVNPRTMESRLVQGLYFAGEVLDIDGDTGGYNLQAAFSTGWLAGRSAADHRERGNK
ncbi:NAD(P)/FAD-dependent oxidoreductase [Candidatus Zixiibacteriota bacterium]